LRPDRQWLWHRLIPYQVIKPLLGGPRGGIRDRLRDGEVLLEIGCLGPHEQAGLGVAVILHDGREWLSRGGDAAADEVGARAPRRVVAEQAILQVIDLHQTGDDGQALAVSRHDRRSLRVGLVQQVDQRRDRVAIVEGDQGLGGMVGRGGPGIAQPFDQEGVVALNQPVPQRQDRLLPHLRGDVEDGQASQRLDGRRAPDLSQDGDQHLTRWCPFGRQQLHQSWDRRGLHPVLVGLALPGRTRFAQVSDLGADCVQAAVLEAFAEKQGPE